VPPPSSSDDDSEDAEEGAVVPDGTTQNTASALTAVPARTRNSY
jgi:hypothetical protein